MSRVVHSFIDSSHAFFTCTNPSIRRCRYNDDEAIENVIKESILTTVPSERIYVIVMDIGDGVMERFRIGGLLVPNSIAPLYRIGEESNNLQYSCMNGNWIEDYDKWMRRMFELLTPHV